MIHTVTVQSLKELGSVMDNVQDPDVWIFALSPSCIPTTSTWYRRLEDAADWGGSGPVVYYPKFNAAGPNDKAPQFIRSPAGDYLGMDYARHRAVGDNIDRAKEDNLFVGANSEPLRGGIFLSKRTWARLKNGWAHDPSDSCDMPGQTYLLGRVYVFRWKEDLFC